MSFKAIFIANTRLICFLYFITYLCSNPVGLTPAAVQSPSSWQRAAESSVLRDGLLRWGPILKSTRSSQLGVMALGKAHCGVMQLGSCVLVLGCIKGVLILFSQIDSLLTITLVDGLASFHSLTILRRKYPGDWPFYLYIIPS